MDIGRSPWIQLGFYEGGQYSPSAPAWVRECIQDEFSGWHSRARVLEVIEVLLFNDADMPNHANIEQWVALASVSAYSDS